MISARWTTAPAVALIVLTASWALAAREEPGAADDPPAATSPAQAGESGRAVPKGMPPLPFGMAWLTIIDTLPEAVYSELPGLPVEADLAGDALPFGEDDLQGRIPTGDKAVWETSLAAREQALARTQAALHREMKRSEDILERAQARLEEARLIRHYAEKACGGSLITGGPIKGLLPPTPEELEANAKSVAEIVKKMKPNKAAQMLQRWDEPLIIDVLKRLSARASSPILGKMPAEVSGRITSRMLTGEVSVRVGGTP
jgi:flagellar motility protein MotE (MotC chaperone)